MKIRPKHYIVTQYWFDYYATEHCTLCGNRGVIDTRGVRTPAGKEVGRLNWCICPNGQIMRKIEGGTPPSVPRYELRNPVSTGPTDPKL